MTIETVRAVEAFFYFVGGVAVGAIFAYLSQWGWIARARSYMLKENLYRSFVDSIAKNPTADRMQAAKEAREMLDDERATLLQQRR